MAYSAYTTQLSEKSSSDFLVFKTFNEDNPFTQSYSRSVLTIKSYLHSGMTLENFKSIFDEYYHPLKNFLYYKLGDVDLAEDMTQEVFIRAWDKRDTIQLETVKSYLYKIANNLAINHFNSGKTRFEMKLKDHDRSVSESPQYVMEKNEFEERLNRAMDNLPEGQRTVFLMNRIEDLTYREIADRLEISVKAVEKRMQNALGSLRSVVQSRL